ncbi:MAG: hypothetical protein ACYDCK_05760 [Thermoplasmatota archaeon]
MRGIGSAALASLIVLAALAAGCVRSPSAALGANSSPAGATNASLPATVESRFDVDTGDAVGAPCPPGAHGCWVSGSGGIGALTVKRIGVTHAILVATWTAGTPAAQKLEVDVFEDKGEGRTGGLVTGDPGPLAGSATGASPLKIDLTGAKLDPSKKYSVWAGPTMPGATHGEVVHAVLTLSYP